MIQNFTVAIIGGGFCGTMVAINLLRQSKSANIILINAGYPLSMGLAFSSYSDMHLLNVRAKNMSAFADEPNHFVEWIKRYEKYHVTDQATLPDLFLPRNFYGHYLKDILEDAIRKKPGSTSFHFIHDEAIDIEIKDHRAHIHFPVAPTVTADKVILAMGNQLPANPKIETPSFYTSKNYYANPWLQEVVSQPDRHKEILIIGNGHTMADVVIGLKEKNHTGKIYAISTNGFDILPHRLPEPYTKFVEELKPAYRLEKLVKLFDKHIHQLNAKGEEIVDSLRPLIQPIWISWSIDERKWFVSHIRHLWEGARHRLPMQIHEQLQQLIADNKLETIAARILDIQEHENNINVRFRRKRDRQIYEINVGSVINCTGPATDVTKIRRPLLENLLQRKLIHPDPLHLGINALPDGKILNEDGTSSKYLYTIGSTLKGILWESTAVPELRLQASHLAEEIINQIHTEKLTIIK